MFDMCEVIKTINFIKFDLLDDASDKVALNCNLQFSAQVPREKTKLERAILIMFKATTETDVMHLEIQARVVFQFQTSECIPKDEQFLDKYYKEAYQFFKEKIDVVMTGLGKENLRFPEISD